MVRSCDVLTVEASSSAPAAEAGSEGIFRSPVPRLKGVFEVRGLLLRFLSEVLLDGDRERRSNLERLTSGSVWSNRERFEIFRSVSAISVYLVSSVALKILASIRLEGILRKDSKV